MSRFRAAVAVYGILRRDGRVLLLRRKGSGYRDGKLSLPAGHLEGEEDAVRGLRRELLEELGISAQGCELALVMHRRRESAGDDEYVDLFFEVREWLGEPRIGEPEKCSELVWADPDELPADVVDYIAVALKSQRGPGHSRMGLTRASGHPTVSRPASVAIRRQCSTLVLLSNTSVC